MSYILFGVMYVYVYVYASFAYALQCALCAAVYTKSRGAHICAALKTNARGCTVQGNGCQEPLSPVVSRGNMRTRGHDLMLVVSRGLAPI